MKITEILNCDNVAIEQTDGKIAIKINKEDADLSQITEIEAILLRILIGKIDTTNIKGIE